MINNNAAISANRFRPTKQAENSNSSVTENATNESHGATGSLGSVGSNYGAKEGFAQSQGQAEQKTKEQVADMSSRMNDVGTHIKLSEAQLADIIARDSLPTEQGTDPALEKITQQFQERFAGQAANKEKFHELMKQSFGENYDASKAENIRQQTLKGDFSWMPKIEVRDGSELQDTSGQQGEGVAEGAYSKSENTIYISRELLNTDPVRAEEILTEEVGHAIDAAINTTDAAGDEGAIFSKLSHGEELSATELNDLRSENDSGVIIIDGKEVEVEYGIFSGIKNAVKGVVNGVKGAVKGAVNFVRDGVMGVVDTVKDTVEKVRDKIKDFASKAWDKFKERFEKIVTSKWLGVALKLATFIPGIGAFAAVASTFLSYAQAAYGVYQGVKNKSFSAVLGGVASIAGGAAGLGGKIGLSQGMVNGLQNFSNYAGKASQAYAAIQSKDVGAIASFAAGMSGSNSSAGQVFSNIARADAIYQAHRNGDTFGAITAGAGLMQDFTGDQGDQVLQSIANSSTAIGNIQTAIDNKDFSVALDLANDAFGGQILSPEAQQSVDKLTGTIGRLQDAHQMVESGDYLGAGQALLSQASSYSSSEETRQNLVSVGQGLVKVDAAVTAYKENRYDDVASLAADVMGAPLDDKTKALLSDLQTKANQVQDFSKAVKSEDFDAITSSLSTLTNGGSDGLTDRLQVVAGGIEQAKALADAIEDKDFDKASGIASNLADLTAGKDNELANTMGNLSNFIAGATAKVDAVVSAYQENRYDDAAVLAAAAAGAPLDDKTKAFLADVQYKANQIQDFGDTIKSKDLDRISNSLSSLTRGESDALTDRVKFIAGGVEQVRALASLVESKDYAAASSTAANLANSVAGKDSGLASTLNTLSDFLNGKIEISLGDIFKGEAA